MFSLAALPGHGIHSMEQFRAAAKPEQLSMLHTHDSAGLSWYAVLLGYPILGYGIGAQTKLLCKEC